MSETPDTPAAAAEASQPAARKVKRPWMTWIKLFLLFLIVVCLNYVGCHEYYRRDLTEDQRYEISRQSINMLQSPEIQKRKTPRQNHVRFPAHHAELHPHAFSA